MIKNLFITLPLLLLIGCSGTPENKVKTEHTKKEVTHKKVPKDYESFYGLFESVELPYLLNHSSIANCKNGHFCQDHHKERIADGNVIEAIQLNYLINMEAINKDHAQFTEWCAANMDNFDDEWEQIMPGIQFKNGSDRMLSLYTYSKENHNCDGFWEVWLIKMTDQNQISDFKKLGLMGYTSFLDAGEEKGAKYHILNVDHEYFIANFTPSQCDITLKRWSTKKGQDWRVDQNLKVDDSISREDVFLTYKY